jgi:hypothetical protein
MVDYESTSSDPKEVVVIYTGSVCARDTLGVRQVSLVWTVISCRGLRTLKYLRHPACDIPVSRSFIVSQNGAADPRTRQIHALATVWAIIGALG